MASQSIVREFYYFVKHEKKWWMIPLIAIVLGLGGLMLFSSTSPLGVFIYPLL